MGQDRKQNNDDRTKNPGAKAAADEPWISNYPPLNEWLMENEARCDWQLRYGKSKNGFMLEQWRMPGSLPFVVLVHTRGHGWEIFTPNHSGAVEATLADAKARIFAKATATRFHVYEMSKGRLLASFAAQGAAEDHARELCTIGEDVDAGTAVVEGNDPPPVISDLDDTIGLKLIVRVHADCTEVRP